MRLTSLVLSATVALNVGLLATASHAATVTVNSGGNIQTAIQNAKPGDTVNIGAGTFNVTTPINVPTGITITGASVDTSHVIFNLAGGSTTSYGFVINGNAQNVTIQQLDLQSNKGVITMAYGSKYQNIHITHNNLKYGFVSFPNGTLGFGISGTIPNYGLQITHNYFHDSPSGVRNWCIWYAVNSNLDYNLFYNIADGGQICTPGDNVTFNWNYGTNMHRMGQEVSIQSDSNFTCSNNTFYNYLQPYYDTEGVSIVGGIGEVDITNNYFAATMASGTSWGTPDGGGLKRFGYAIECTGRPANVTNNTFVGTWAELVASDMVGANVVNNRVFGTGIWANFAGEPGPFGQGSVKASNNAMDSNASHAPAAPSNNWAGPKFK